MIWFRGEAANARVGEATTPQRSRPQDSPPDTGTSAGAPSSVAPMSQETSQFGVRRRVAMETFNRRNYVDSFREYCERRAKENADFGLVHSAAMMAAELEAYKNAISCNDGETMMILEKLWLQRWGDNGKHRYVIAGAEMILSAAFRSCRETTIIYAHSAFSKRGEKGHSIAGDDVTEEHVLLCKSALPLSTSPQYYEDVMFRASMNGTLLHHLRTFHGSDYLSGKRRSHIRSQQTKRPKRSEDTKLYRRVLRQASVFDGSVGSLAFPAVEAKAAATTIWIEAGGVQRVLNETAVRRGLGPTLGRKVLASCDDLRNVDGVRIGAVVLGFRIPVRKKDPTAPLKASDTVKPAGATVDGANKSGTKLLSSVLGNAGKGYEYYESVTVTLGSGDNVSFRRGREATNDDWLVPLIGDAEFPHAQWPIRVMDIFVKNGDVYFAFCWLYSAGDLQSEDYLGPAKFKKSAAGFDVERERAEGDQVYVLPVSYTTGSKILRYDATDRPVANSIFRKRILREARMTLGKMPEPKSAELSVDEEVQMAEASALDVAERRSRRDYAYKLIPSVNDVEEIEWSSTLARTSLSNTTFAGAFDVNGLVVEQSKFVVGYRDCADVVHDSLFAHEAALAAIETAAAFGPVKIRAVSLEPSSLADVLGAIGIRDDDLPGTHGIALEVYAPGMTVKLASDRDREKRQPRRRRDESEAPAAIEGSDARAAKRTSYEPPEGQVTFLEKAIAEKAANLAVEARARKAKRHVEREQKRGAPAYVAATQLELSVSLNVHKLPKFSDSPHFRRFKKRKQKRRDVDVCVAEVLAGIEQVATSAPTQSEIENVQRALSLNDRKDLEAKRRLAQSLQKKKAEVSKEILSQSHQVRGFSSHTIALKMSRATITAANEGTIDAFERASDDCVEVIRKKLELVFTLDVQLAKLAKEQREILRRRQPQPKRQKTASAKATNEKSTNDDDMDVDNSDDDFDDFDVNTDVDNDDDDDDTDSDDDDTDSDDDVGGFNMRHASLLEKDAADLLAAVEEEASETTTTPFSPNPRALSPSFPLEAISVRNLSS